MMGWKLSDEVLGRSPGHDPKWWNLSQVIGKGEHT